MLKTYTSISGVREPLSAVGPYFDVLAAIESQAFSLKSPEQFFSLYSPPKTESAFKASRERLEEDIKFTARVVSPSHTPQIDLIAHGHQDRQRVHQSERISIHPVLYALSS